MILSILSKSATYFFFLKGKIKREQSKYEHRIVRVCWCPNQSKFLCVSISWTYNLSLLVDIVEEEDQETYDDIDTSSDRVEPEPIDEDIYEELPGPTPHFTTIVLKFLGFFESTN